MIVAIDTGTTESAILLWDGQRVIHHQFLPNEQLLAELPLWATDCPRLVIEQIASYGMAVGRETFATVHWSGRFHQQWEHAGGTVALVPRSTVKLHLCLSMRARDSNVRMALIDRFGQPGTKKQPGRLYGISKHAWAALALAVTALDKGIG